METAVIVDAVRSPLGRRNGQLSGWHPVDLAARMLGELAARNDLDPALIDDVIVGCVSQVGAQAVNLGRNAVLAAGWPESVPATTVDRQCASSQQAVHFAAQGVMAGAYDIVVAAGVEVMSLVPLGAAAQIRDAGQPFPPALHDRYEPVGGLQPQGVAAEGLAARWGLTRDQLDAYALTSRQRAADARDSGRFGGEIVAVAEKILDREGHRIVETGRSVAVDDTIGEASAEALAALRPAFQVDGVITAANSAQIADGAAAVLIMSEARATALGLRPRARFRAFAVAGADPLAMFTGPGPATARVLARAGLALDDIDVFEVHEAFAAAVLVWAAEHPADPARVNPNGGALALGHPAGASGARLLATLINEVERRGGRYGLQVMGAGGGLAQALILEVG